MFQQVAPLHVSVRDIGGQPAVCFGLWMLTLHGLRLTHSLCASCAADGLEKSCCIRLVVKGACYRDKCKSQTQLLSSNISQNWRIISAELVLCQHYVDPMTMSLKVGGPRGCTLQVSCRPRLLIGLAVVLALDLAHIPEWFASCLAVKTRLCKQEPMMQL